MFSYVSSDKFRYSISVISHCVNIIQIRSFFWSVFSCIWTEYRKIRTRKTSYLDTFHTMSGKTGTPIPACYVGSNKRSPWSFPLSFLFVKYGISVSLIASSNLLSFSFMLVEKTFLYILFWQGKKKLMSIYTKHDSNLIKIGLTLSNLDKKFSFRL